MLTFNGILIVESELCCRPKMQVSAEFRRLQSPELVAETDAWLLEFFGAEEHVLRFCDPATGKQTLLMSPRAVAQMRAERALQTFLPAT